MKMHVPQPCSINDTDSNTHRVTNRTNPGNLHGHVHRRQPRTCLESNARVQISKFSCSFEKPVASCSWLFSIREIERKKKHELSISFYPYCDSIFSDVKCFRKKYWCYFSKCDVKQNGIGGARRAVHAWFYSFFLRYLDFFFITLYIYKHSASLGRFVPHLDVVYGIYRGLPIDILKVALNE